MIDRGERPAVSNICIARKKTIARRLTESKQHVPHIYLTVDINLDSLLKLRAELNAGLESRGWEPGPLAGAEAAVGWFADKIRADLGDVP